ncbi:hypothetical protein BN2497_7595 [Janthinobacterium sp. CG23_2]|nr:hypothetical protein BN2497_7595 [Janthinobacterium sp. CG23_2]CUU30195.1 hypothetical protein BN3177_7595 [Janthinobacterium sp. CG23_2]
MESFRASICALRQAGHQQAAAPPSTGTATTGGSSVHQHGPAVPSAMAQPNCAPQRLQVLMARRFPARSATMGKDKCGRCHSWAFPDQLMRGHQRRKKEVKGGWDSFKASLTDQK